MKTLRPYQETIVNDVVNGKTNAIVCLPCGAGKTVIASSIMDRLPGKKIFIVPRLELIKQAHDEFGDVDIIWSNHTDISGKDIILASKDSLLAQLDAVPKERPLTLLFDECHIGIKTTHEIVEKIQPTRVLGLTATPERMDGLALLKGSDEIHKYGVFDELLKKETTPSLIRKQYLTPLRYYARPIKNITYVKPKSATGNELTGSQMSALFTKEKVWGDLVQCYEAYGKGRPAIGFTPTIQMAEKVVSIFQNAGYNFQVIHGGMKVAERAQLIEGLKDGSIQGLVNAALLTYGFDCPVASYAFSCRHIKSRPLWFQMVGRILRPAEGKTDAIFVDHGDSIAEFSEPEHPIPILDECIDWHVDGEDDIERDARKKKHEKANDTIALIKELDPIPVKMVEITAEDYYTRLLRIVSNLQDQNNGLSEQINRKEKELSDTEKRLSHAIEQADKKQAALQKKLSNAQESMQDALLEKQKMQEELKKKRMPTINPDKTFEYIRKNYCWARRFLEDRNVYHSKEDAHEATEYYLRKQESKLDFRFDERTFQRGMDYWQAHYKHDWN